MSPVKDPRQPSPIAEPHAGQTVLGGFVLEKVLGEGTFATAWRAQQSGTKRKAVVKIAHPHLMHGEERRRVEARFASEFTAASEVQHPCLVTVYTWGKVNQHLPAIVMEYLPGKTMAQVLQRRAPLALATCLKLAGRVASALVAIHEAGIVHRDVSPNNIILSRTSQGKVSCKLLDFGVAHFEASPNPVQGPVGTPLYIAPEQLYGQCTPASDVYSLGAVMWWMLTGKELHSTLQSALGSGAHEPPPDICQYAPGLPQKISNLMRAMLWPDPNRRLSAQDCLDHFSLVLNNLPDAAKEHTSLLGQAHKPSQQPNTRPNRRATPALMRSAPLSSNNHPVAPTSEGTLPGIRHAEISAVAPPGPNPKDVERFTTTIPRLLTALEAALKHRQDTRALGLAVEISRCAQRLQASSISQLAELIIEMKCADLHTEAADMFPSLKAACETLVIPTTHG